MNVFSANKPCTLENVSNLPWKYAFLRVKCSGSCALWSICLLQTLNSAYEHISKHCFCLLSTHALVERNYISLIDLQTDAVNYWNKTFIII